jgi:hypothetical protein
VRDSVWTVPISLAATKGIPCWFLFLPLLRCFRSGGSRSVKEHHLRGEKSHSGILGSKAACAYPRRYRGLPRPSSALKPSHPPDSVALFGPMVVSVWRLMKPFRFPHSIVLRVVLAYAWCHRGHLVRLHDAQFTLHPTSIRWGVASLFDGITHIAGLH